MNALYRDTAAMANNFFVYAVIGLLMLAIGIALCFAWFFDRGDAEEDAPQ